MKRKLKEIEPYGPSLSTGSRKGGPRSKFQAGSRAETNLACRPWVARRSTPSSTGQRNRPQQLWRYLTRHHKRSPPAPIETFARYHQGSRLHPRTAQACRGQNRGRPLGTRVTSSFVKRTRPVLVLHERKSRVTLAARLAGKTAAENHFGYAGGVRWVDPALRKSITFDNDTAFAQHSLLNHDCAMTTWFCDAYVSWQKGGIENANGRLRRWLPRQIDIDKVSDQEIQDIVITANLTPRKCLGFKTPFRQSSKTLAKTCKSGSRKSLCTHYNIQGAPFKRDWRCG